MSMYKKSFERFKEVLKWISNHKYIFVTLVFLAIILVLDDNNMISHMKNNAKINELANDIRAMEADSAGVQAKLKLYTDGDINVIEDVARAQGLLKKNEEVFIIKQ